MSPKVVSPNLPRSTNFIDRSSISIFSSRRSHLDTFHFDCPRLPPVLPLPHGVRLEFAGYSAKAMRGPRDRREDLKERTCVRLPLIREVEALDTDIPLVKRRIRQRETQKRKAEKAEKTVEQSMAKTTRPSEDDLNPNVRKPSPSFKAMC